jgi:hypothetical protein
LLIVNCVAIRWQGTRFASFAAIVACGSGSGSG